MKLVDGIKHGTQYQYRVKKCRCPECQQWKTQDQRLYRKRRRDRLWGTGPNSQLPS